MKHLSESVDQWGIPTSNPDRSLEEAEEASGREVLYHWTSNKAAEEIRRTRTLKPGKPNDRDVAGVYLTDLDNAEDVRMILGSDISTEVCIPVPLESLDLSRAAKPQLYHGEIMSGERYAMNSLKSVHEIVYLDEIKLDESLEEGARGSKKLTAKVWLQDRFEKVSDDWESDLGRAEERKKISTYLMKEGDPVLLPQKWQNWQTPAGAELDHDGYDDVEEEGDEWIANIYDVKISRIVPSSLEPPTVPDGEEGGSRNAQVAFGRGLRVGDSKYAPSEPHHVGRSFNYATMSDPVLDWTLQVIIDGPESLSESVGGKSPIEKEIISVGESVDQWGLPLKEAYTPEKYLKGVRNRKERRKEIEKNAAAHKKGQSQFDDAAWKTDFKKSGERQETKPSKYTSKFKEKFGEGLDESLEKSIKNKAEKCGVPLGIARQVVKRGQAAWASGHRPGTTPEQWGLARLNSFCTGGKTTTTADKDLYKKWKKKG